ncbi:MAG: tRNA (adenosine(37)-N6)-threonylcarbamoyltransferase complex dimerization subunit type 1 TsaB [Oscillospiraceae bacterium]|nr:tRNA (adenosine(37)-N6)-threonylcarbamoyltransferase complex dimerization subunit type 1 TsaB [Oscillospiraceae bacterium]
MTILGIDTSGKTASCAVLRDGVILGQNTVYTKLTHSQVILPFVKRLLEDTNLTLSDIDLVAVADGPGSYTGLRIGISAVKGMCIDGKKCLGVSTLEALATNCIGSKARIFSLLNARPGIVYFGVYDSDGETLTNITPDAVVNAEAVLEAANSYDGDIVLVGDCISNIKEKFFAEDNRIRLAPPHERLQLASSVCLTALAHIDEAISDDELSARYLQITKAEKDLKEKEEK